MNNPFSKRNRSTGNAAITGLRIALWLLPSIILPIIFLASTLLTNEWYAGGIPALLVVVGLGWIDQRICCQQLMLDPVKERLQMMRGTLAFAMFQLVIAPALSFAVLFGCYVIFIIMN